MGFASLNPSYALARFALLARSRLEPARRPALGRRCARQQFDQRHGRLRRSGLRRHRSLVIGVLLQRLRNRTGIFHGAADLAHVEQSEINLALGDLLLTRIEADDLYL